MTSAVTSEGENLKARLKSIWTAGDYDRFSRYMEGGAREFYERLNIVPGCQLLDVACGSGQLALMAAKDGIGVTGVDIASNLVERARARAQAEGLRARFEEADAEALPFENASFDVVASLIGAMFAPRPELVAKELRQMGCPRLPCGATKPPSVSDLDMDSRNSASRGGSTFLATPFHRRMWWNSFVSTMDRQIGRSHHWTPIAVSVSAVNSKRSGPLTIGRGRTARWCSLNTWK